MVQRGETKPDSNQAVEIVQQMRQELGDKEFDATIEAIKKEVTQPDFDPETSPLLETHGGGGSLLLLIEEIFGFGKEASHHIVSSQ